MIGKTDAFSQDVGELSRFEQFAAEVSTRFINLEAHELDDEINRTLGSFGQFMEADRCFIFLPKEGATNHILAHMWTGPHVDPNPEVVGLVVQETFPWLRDNMNRHDDIIVPDVDWLPMEARPEQQYCQEKGIQSFVMCPMYSRDFVVGMIGLDWIRCQKEWTAEELRRLRLLGEIVAGAILRRRKDHEIQRLTERLEAENEYLRAEISVKYSHEEITGDSQAIKSALELVEQVAPTESTVLLLGETGTGKELLARAIHRLSPRKDRCWVSMNCAALTTTLVEAELFGREKGAYTGAMSKQVGRFEIADGSTLFLDEVGELPLEIQAKLLRVLQSGEFERLGSPRTVRVDVRVIAASNRDLSKAVRDGDFREDLFYRLNVFPIAVPPLRDRREDIPALVWEFVQEFAEKMGKTIDTIPKQTMQNLQQYDWPGNIRELRNIIERAVIVTREDALHARLPDNQETPDQDMALIDVERNHILEVLERTRGQVKGKGGAAELLEVKPTTLQSKMKKLGIDRGEI